MFTFVAMNVVFANNIFDNIVRSSRFAVGKYLRREYFSKVVGAQAGTCRAGLEAFTAIRALHRNRTLASAYALAAGLFETVPTAETDAMLAPAATTATHVSSHTLAPLVNMSPSAFPPPPAIPSSLLVHNLRQDLKHMVRYKKRNQDLVLYTTNSKMCPVLKRLRKRLVLRKRLWKKVRRDPGILVIQTLPFDSFVICVFLFMQTTRIFFGSSKNRRG
jgi:hypothetical protein